MEKSLIVKLPAVVDHTGLKRPGVLTYKIGQYVAPTYATNLTTDNPDECYLVRNGTKITGSVFSASETTNDLEIHGTYFVKKMPTIDAKSYIDFKDMAFFVSLTEIDWTTNTKNTNITGSIENLGKCVNLTKLKIALSVANKPHIYGSLNALFDALFANGKTSGSVYVYNENTSIKYNGSTLTTGFSKYFDFTGGGWAERV